MIYLDYSATTPVNADVLSTFNKICIDYFGNANALYRLGTEGRKLMEAASQQVLDLLSMKDHEVIFTSGATEANNLALKGVMAHYNQRGKHIITTKLEHSSIKETAIYMVNQGYEVSYVNTLENGMIDLDNLKDLIKEDTVLVSINYVNSEIGIVQPIEAITTMLKDYPKVIFHVDATQVIGKIFTNLDRVDLVSFSAHKFYGLKGIGCLIKNKKIELEPLLHGGKSQSKYRSGTPALPLIVSLSKALRLSIYNLEDKYKHVDILNKKIKKFLNGVEGILINSNDNCVPHIINISIPLIKPETMIHALEANDVYISTQSACSSLDKGSDALIALGKSSDVALSSLRISLSYQTREEDVEKFLKIFKKEYDALKKVVRE